MQAAAETAPVKWLVYRLLAAGDKSARLMRVLSLQLCGVLGSCPEVARQVRELGDAKSSLGDAKSSLGDVKSSLGDAKSSLGDVRSSLGDA